MNRGRVEIVQGAAASVFFNIEVFRPERKRVSSRGQAMDLSILSGSSPSSSRSNVYKPFMEDRVLSRLIGQGSEAPRTGPSRGRCIVLAPRSELCSRNPHSARHTDPCCPTANVPIRTHARRNNTWRFKIVATPTPSRALPVARRELSR